MIYKKIVKIPLYENLLIYYYNIIFNIIMSLKWMSGFKWNVNVRDMILKSFKKYICKEYNSPSFEKDGVVLKFINRNKEKYLS